MIRGCHRLWFLTWLLVWGGAAWGQFERIHEWSDQWRPHPGLNGRPSIRPGFSHTFEFAPPTLEPITPAKLRIELPGAETHHQGDFPSVPYVERVFQVGDTPIAGVHWQVLEALQSVHPVDLLRAPPALYWTQGFGPLTTSMQTGSFPGTVLTWRQHKDRLWVRVHPTHWEAMSGRLMHISRLDVQLLETLEPPPLCTGSVCDAKSLIVVREGNLDAARKLQAFHSMHYLMQSEIVTVESIQLFSPEVDESAFPTGFSDDPHAQSLVVPFDPVTGEGYDYSTARKLVHFLHARLRPQGSLEYITLLGDELDIPPSYYFSVRAGIRSQVGVTDLCYGATEQCQRPWAAVGRLPLHGQAAMDRYLAKVQRWLRVAQQPSTSELALYGGKAFGGPFYIGELGALRLLQGTDWRGVRKNFRTGGDFHRKQVLDMVQGNAPSSFVYYLDHGQTNLWSIERQFVSSLEILQPKDMGRVVNPVVFSIACTNAAFDLKTSKDRLVDFTAAGSDSVGVALLKSTAGAVAYVGSARPAIGSPVFEIDGRGNLDIQDSTHGLKLLDTAVESYAKGQALRLGDAVLNSQSVFASNAGSAWEADMHRWSLFNLVLLGDPVMMLPRRGSHARVDPIATALDWIEASFMGHFPWLTLSQDRTAALRIELPVPARVRLFHQVFDAGQVEESVVWDESAPSGFVDMPVEDPIGRQVYFARIENTVGVPSERQVWFGTR